MVPREALARAIWGDEAVLLGRSLDAHVTRLRRKLAAQAGGPRIDATRGVGYKLVA